MTVSEYTHLKQQIVLSVGANEKHGQILHTLKEFYKDDIDSARRFEKITKLDHLLNILEIRDVLSKDDIGPLKEIARRLPNSTVLLRKLNDYEALRAKGECISCYGSDVTNYSSNGAQVVNTFNINPFGNLSERKRQRIINTVVNEIGTYWRDLARNLEIRECKIDEIESNSTTLSMKAAKVMDEYNEIADPQRCFFALCNALERIRRKDISKSLQNIMTMNI